MTALKAFAGAQKMWKLAFLCKTFHNLKHVESLELVVLYSHI